MARDHDIDLLLRELDERAIHVPAQAYGVRENRELLESLRSPERYLLWLCSHMPTLQRDGLLEINELLPQWDEPIHRQLMHIERVRFPAFIRPLVHEILDHVVASDGPQVILDVGAGAMEIERQVVEQLLARRDTPPLTFIGLDDSQNALDLARENLAELGDTVEMLAMPLCEALALPAPRGRGRIRVILTRGSASELAAAPAGRVGLIFHSFLKHHLTMQQRDALDQTTARLAPVVLEYDGYRSWAFLVPVSLLTWHAPAFLAAYVFSYVRFETRRELKRRHHGDHLRFLENGSYLCRRVRA